MGGKQMYTDVSRIILNRETPRDCIDWSRLEANTQPVDLDNFQSLRYKMKQVVSLYILGCERLPIGDGTYQGYVNSDSSWMLLINPPDESVLELFEFWKLKQLYIRFSSFENLDVSSMPKLTELNISCNKCLSAVTGLERLIHLKHLDIHNTHLQDTSVIGKLLSLILLDASQTHIEDARFLEDLRNLTELNLSGCEIGVFPHLGKLDHLDTLYLDGSQIGELIETNFPERIQNISLAYSTVRWIPEAIRNLRQLKLLDLSGLTLEQLPEWLPEINLKFTRSGYSGILLSGTTITGVDMSIFDQPHEMIRQWFQERREEEKLVSQSEVKVVFLGDGGAGKSYTIARLLNDGGTPKEFDSVSTPGIVVSDKTYTIGNMLVKVHFWDFGGQEILHSMHRMFLTERTLYVVMLNVRDGNQDERARYWLHNIKSFAGNAPVMLVMNHMDQNSNATINEMDLRTIYPRMTEIVKMSVLCDNSERFLTNFVATLKRQISMMDNLAVSVPVTWSKIRQRLETMPDAYISGRTFHAICDECGMENEPELRRSLLNWFSDLGVSFCYHSNSKLDDYVVLRPEWITNAIYMILFNKIDEVRNGMVSHEVIHRLLGNPSDQIGRVMPHVTYNPYEVEYVLNLIRTFRLSFQVNEDLEFIPMLCDSNSVPVAEEYEYDPNTLEFRMEYEYLPNNVLYRLMVDLRADLDTNNVWLAGARFIQNYTGLSAVVKSEGNILRILVRSTNPLHKANTYLSVIKNCLDRINRDMEIPKPVSVVVYKADGIVETIDYDDLIYALEDGETSYRSLVRRKKIPIEDILNQTGRSAEQEQKMLLKDVILACEQLQSHKSFWIASEDIRNTYMRDLLRYKDYYVVDQMLTGTSAGGNISGELDLEIRRDPRIPWSVLEAVNLKGSGNSQIQSWNNHLQRLLDNWSSAGRPFLFQVSYVDSARDSFEKVIQDYGEHLRYYGPGQYTLLSSQLINLNPRLDSSRRIRTFQCVYDCGGIPITVYHIFVHLGMDRVVEEKKIQMLQMPANEYKVVLLGDGEAGKSLTVARLKDPKMDTRKFDGEVTPGVNIKSKNYVVDGRTVQVNFWDFGGQQILHSMHRLFLSERALYVILLNTRNDSQDDRARFWLRYVQTYAPGAPVLLVLNKIDQNPNASINERELMRQYPNLKEILRISAREDDESTFQKEFLDKIEAQIKAVPPEETVFLKKGIQIRDKLRAIEEPRISRKDFLKICRDVGLLDADEQENLLRQLNRAGVCVYFGESSDTNKQMLLKPEWITDAIYMILFNKHSSVTNGVISHQEIDNLYDGIGKNIRKVSDMEFSSEDTGYVLNVMRWFRLSFRLSDGNHEFIPMLCSRNETPVAEEYSKAEDTLEFHFCFEYLPTDVLYQLMVARRFELDLDNVWLTGALFSDGNGTSAVVMTAGNTMKFFVRGKGGIQDARKYMTGIKGDVDKIIFSRKLGISERRMVYKYGGKREIFNYDRLENGESYQVSHMISVAHKCAVPIRDILDQTDRSVELNQKKMIQNVLDACREIQSNNDCWKMKEPSRNRIMRGYLSGKDFFVQDQTEIGTSSTGKTAGRPDLVISEDAKSAKVIVEALNITGTGQNDLNRWDEHLHRLAVNYNVGGHKILILVTYLKCHLAKFRDISNTYYQRMRDHGPEEYGGRPDACQILPMERNGANIHITRADYYCDGYRPSVYHFMVYIPVE